MLLLLLRNASAPNTHQIFRFFTWMPCIQTQTLLVLTGKTILPTISKLFLNSLNTQNYFFKPPEEKIFNSKFQVECFFCCIGQHLIPQLRMINQIKYIWTQHNILSHCLVNTRIGQDTTLKAFPKPQYYKGASLINYFPLYLRLTEKKTMLVHFAE